MKAIVLTGIVWPICYIIDNFHFELIPKTWDVWWNK
jgi:hypothetical protein